MGNKVRVECQPFSDLSNGYFRNPILAGEYPDPTIVRVGEDYYMTHSSMHAVPGLLVWHSQDLINWKPLDYALRSYVGDVWAPDIVFFNKCFYIYFPAQVRESDGTLRRTNFVIKAEDPSGPWSDPVDLNLGNIDPGHLVDNEGTRWLFLSGGQLVRLDSSGCKTAGEVRKVYDGWPYPEDWDVECKCLESPKLFRKDEYYYMVSAQGGTAGPPTSHMVIAARARSPEGPWENSPYNPILHTEGSLDHWWSQGHASLIDDPGGGWWMVFHGYESGFRTLGRQTLLLPIRWTEDGWPQVQEGFTSSDIMPKSGGHDVGHGLPLSDDFPGPELGLQWRRWDRGTYEDFYTVSPGSLLLDSGGESPADSPLLACFPVNHSYEAEVLVTVPKEGESGIVLWYDEKNYAGISLSEGKIYVHWLWGRSFQGLFGSQSVYLKIRNKNHSTSFYFSADGRTWMKTEISADLSGFHHNVLGGFRTLKIALFSAGGGKARFEKFRYCGLD